MAMHQQEMTDQQKADWRQRRGRHQVKVLQELGEVKHNGRTYRSVRVRIEDGSEYVSLRLYNEKGKFIKQFMVEPEAARDVGKLLDWVTENPHNARANAELQAWKALSGYKFMMFGYWAAIWVHLNRICLDTLPSPFKNLVEVARHHNGWEGR